MAEQAHIKNTCLKAVIGDITVEKADAIVNAANSGLMGGGGVDGAIHRAGGPAILDDCRRIVAQIGRLPAGKAVITVAGKLKATHVIHTVGPVWHGGNSHEADILTSCYRECLKLASSHNLKSIAFPAISTGIYGYPPDLATGIAVAAVAGFIRDEDCRIEEVRFVLYDRGSFNLYIQELDKLAGKG
jgi:O-acetyl-ADP-ribose deacetylase (regulator of RNase III)